MGIHKKKCKLNTSCQQQRSILSGCTDKVLEALVFDQMKSRVDTVLAEVDATLDNIHVFARVKLTVDDTSVHINAYIICDL